MYDDLLDALRAIQGVQFAEYEWRTRPTCDHGTVRIDFEASDDDGDDEKQNRAWEGSVDLFTHGRKPALIAAVEAALTGVCENCWHVNSEQYERNTGLIHTEWVFQLEAR